MSNALLNAVMPLALPPTQKVVLIVLADAARDPDDADRPRQAWTPMRGRDGKPGLVERTCLGDRAIRYALRELEAAGLIVTTPVPGRGVLYTVLPTAGDGRVAPAASAGAAPSSPEPTMGPDGAATDSRTTCPPPRHDVPPGTTCPPAPHAEREASRAGGAAPRAPNPLIPLKNPSETSSPQRRARKQGGAAALAFEPPGWVPPEAWRGWIEMRIAKGAEPTERACQLAVAKLRSLADDGHPPGDVLDRSTLNRWTDLWPTQETRHDRPIAPPTHDRARRDNVNPHPGGRIGAAADRAFGRVADR